MQPDVVERLLDLNRRFYQRFADEFAATRLSPQPGVAKALESSPPDADVLDIGCGPGTLAVALQEGGHHGRYVGLDSSPAFLAMAQTRRPNGVFRQVDLASAGWSRSADGPFTRVYAFAVLHHLPGQATRRTWAREARSLVASDGLLYVSAWDFLASARLRSRLANWEEVGLSNGQVEPGDYLVEWRRGGRGLRYVHHFQPDELAELAEAGGFELLEGYTADGEGGRLGVYQVWRPHTTEGPDL